MPVVSAGTVDRGQAPAACIARIVWATIAALVQSPGHGATPPASPLKTSPLTAEEQLATFSVPPGYKVELVAAEPDGGKFVALAFDHAGRLWTMTALEYPLDANESPAEAKALFARGGRDRVLVFDTPTHPGRQKPRVFAEGLVIPLGLLPYQDGAFVQYGGEIRFYRDTDGDGRADQHESILTGFGIEDSHLFPHQFMRAPGGWILMAQGAFNYSKVKAGDGSVTDYNKTKLARFTPDGKRFEIIGWGPCNIWGLVVDRLGEVFFQEANDQGWPMMPFLEGASYPLCGDDVPRPYAPPFPKTGEKEMGGTGLSGLALSEGADSFPGRWRDVFFIANPITGKIQAIRCHRSGSRREEALTSKSEIPNPKSEIDQSLVTSAATKDESGNGWRLEHLPDFLQCGDPWFRPVAIAFGPDGCLYIVDWYNKIISHNEVPRNHPERDKTRGRIWRVRLESQPHRTIVPNLYKASDNELLIHLRAANTWEVNAAWQEIVDRKAVTLAPQLAKQALDDTQPADLRIRALWAIEGLGKVELAQIEKLATAQHRSVRKEALRVAGAQTDRLRDSDRLFALGQRAMGDGDQLVRQEGFRLLARILGETRGQVTRAPRIVGALLEAAIQPPATGGSKFQPYFAAFETFLARRALEQHPHEVMAWLDKTKSASIEARALGCVTLGGIEGAKRFTSLLPELRRGLSTEELLLIASVPNEPAANSALKTALAIPQTLRLLYDNRGRLLDHTALAPLLADAARALIANDPSDANQDLMVKLAAGFKLSALEDDVAQVAERAAGVLPAGVAESRSADGTSAALSLAAVRALREFDSTRVDLFRRFAASANATLQREAVTALAAAKSEAAVPALLEVWPSLTPILRKTAVDRLASSPVSARQLVNAVSSGAITRDELDGHTLDKLVTVLPDDAIVKLLVAELSSTLRPVLRLNGADGDYVDTDITLRGPFTVECWVKLDPGISNQDSILAAPGYLDANFHDGRFRVWIGGAIHDIVVSSKPISPESWTHVAFSRDGEGHFRLYLNGELDVTGTAVEKRDFEHLKVGHSNVAGGTAGEFAEFRVWSVCRSADEIRGTANLALESARGLAGRRNSTPDTASINASGSVDEPRAAARMAALLYHGSGDSWGKLRGNARLERTADFPPLMTETEAKGMEAKFSRFRALANTSGDVARGLLVFTTVCAVCHTVRGQGGQIGPVLDGAGANGVEALLRNILTPNAAMEAGYRQFRIETNEGEVQEGLLVSQDDNLVVLRRANAEDLRIPRANVKRSRFTKVSIMPESLLEPLKPQEVADLFAYLRTLK